MREIAFIRQNKEKWLQFEKAIEQKKIDNPDDLANLYIHLINDLAYAQTYYKKSKLVAYLNNLAVRVYQKIYQTKREESNVFVHFFKVEVPLLLYQYRRYILYSFSFFLWKYRSTRGTTSPTARSSCDRNGNDYGTDCQ